MNQAWRNGRACGRGIIGTLSVQMVARMFTALVVLVQAAAVAAAAAPEGGRWQARVEPPRKGLPAVSIVLGEPGPYVPTVNARIEMRATGGLRPFDGYIGYHFEAAGRRTIDIPVVARAVVAAGGQWSFGTWVQLETRYPGVQLNRELVVEWRDRSMNLVAVSNAGRPPWTAPRPLRIVPSTAAGDHPCCFGKEPHVRETAGLPRQAQWYAAFSGVVVDTAVWLDLPMATREAIFAAVPVTFVGLPREGQAMTQLDRTLLPVELLAQPGSYTIPWPYTPQARTINTADSWRPKVASRVVTGKGSPFIARSGVAVFVADASALARPLPSLSVFRPDLPFDTVDSFAWPRLSAVLFEYRVVILAMATVLLSILLWLAIRRRPGVTAIAIPILAAAAVIGGRSLIRKSADQIVRETWRPLAPGIVAHRVETTQYGPTPIGELAVTEDVTRLSVSSHGEVIQEAEVRRSHTAPGHGAMYVFRELAWDQTSRAVQRTVLRQPLTVRVRSRNAQRLTFDYESEFPAHSAFARWVSDGRIHYGEALLAGGRRGRAEIRTARAVWQPWASSGPWVPGGMTVGVSGRDQSRETMAAWSAWTPDAPKRGEAWRMIDRPVKRPDGSWACTFVLPSSPQDAGGAISIQGPLLRSATIEGPNGILRLETAGMQRHRIVVPLADVRRVAHGGIVVVSVELLREIELTEISLDYEPERGR